MADGTKTTMCNNCPYEATIDELKRDSKRNSEQHREFYTRFSTNEKELAISTERYNNLLSMIGRIESSVEKMSMAMNEIKEKPGKKWEQVSMYVITCILGAVIGFIFTMLFKGGI